MTKFIQLTNTYGLDLYLQPEDVKAVVPDSGKGSWTQVYLYGACDHRIYVKESPADVVMAVQNALIPQLSPPNSASFPGRN